MAESIKCLHLKDFCLKENLHLHVTRNTYKKLQIEDLHMHDFFEIVYFSSGVGCMTMNQKKYPIIPGDVYIIPPNFLHSFQVIKNLKYFNLLLNFKALTKNEIAWISEYKNFSDIFSKSNRLSKCFHFPAPVTKKIECFLTSAWESVSARSAGFAADLKGYSLLIINEILRLQLQFPNQKFYTQKSPEMLSSICNYIFLHFNEKITLSQLAKMHQVTANHFSRFFREQTGTSVISYIHSIRIAEACRLLLNNPEMNISEVASQCGFQNPAYFSEIFKKILHLSPTNFRQNGGLANGFSGINRYSQ